MNEQREELRESSRFYRLVQELTARLAGAQGSEIDAAVDDCLAWMGEHFGVESVSLGGISKSGELTPALRVWRSQQLLMSFRRAIPFLIRGGPPL